MTDDSIRERLIVIETGVAELKTGLLGGPGRKGLIQMLNDRVEGVEGRVGFLETWRGWVLGAAAGVAGAAGIIGYFFGISQ